MSIATHASRRTQKISIKKARFTLILAQASTRSRVLWWTVAETAALVALSLWQVLYIRAFFETKRRL